MKKILISIDGVPGSGKSKRISVFMNELVKMNNKDFYVIKVDEPVEEFEKSCMLKKYYEDKTRWGYTFQTLAAFLRIKKLREAIKMFELLKEKDGTDSHHIADDDNKVLVILSERCIVSDGIFMKNIFDQGFVSKDEYDTYLGWSNEWGNVFSDLEICHIFLECPLDTCIQRVKQRGRESERAMDEKYQRSLIKSHESFFDQKEQNLVPVLKLDGAVDMFVETEKFKDQLTQVVEFVSKQAQKIKQRELTTAATKKRRVEQETPTTNFVYFIIILNYFVLILNIIFFREKIKGYIFF